MFTTLPAILMLVVGLFTLALAILRRVQSGRSPVVLTYGNDAEGFAGKLFRMIVAALVVHLLAIAAFPDAVGATLGRIPMLDKPLLHAVGLVLMTLGGGLTMLSQWAMRHSWKIGIPEEQDAPLVTSGLYAFSRNPIYVGMVTALTGTVLAVPNVASVALTLSAWISISYQIHMEETYLSRAFGEAYGAYCKRVRRWI
ncbi:isoprenylcysteine carboxylmethyltransferase family protein [Ensifer sp. T173]|uniref:Isoprenylcysteine carboxylmethyltransferase family protein n=2 Tax=Ensifer TaxID=106591 RepID=A0AAW4FQ11_9HYPH|nr:isoprenylcysteine carboxylmethyltransferase family protein [Ensifer canadensis]MBM3093412.1 isoprenylcysteine carboxylmethyltransferase family protein [Ensifer canadensis]UBI77196.1 isoprenylcysteine carboxylmethyltransferase family protein [Ensifer canadensis]